jgi:hypothetical protein
MKHFLSNHIAFALAWFIINVSIGSFCCRSKDVFAYFRRLIDPRFGPNYWFPIHAGRLNAKAM